MRFHGGGGDYVRINNGFAVLVVKPVEFPSATFDEKEGYFVKSSLLLTMSSVMPS